MITKEEYLEKYINRNIWVYDGYKNKYFQVKKGYHNADDLNKLNRNNSIEWRTKEDKNGNQHRFYTFLKDIFPTREAARRYKREIWDLIGAQNNEDDDISLWFSLSRASWAVLPRVAMEAMPKDWQNKMCKLLFELDDAFPNFPTDFKYVVNLRSRETGKYIKMPEWMGNYRHPN